MAKTLRQRNLDIQILAGIYVGFEIELPLRNGSFWNRVQKLAAFQTNITLVY